jgi:predicted transposase/invertase (TIGR01784 family)
MATTKMLTKFLDPKNDIAFKKIFGTPKNQDILIHFLNDMLVFKEGKPITSVTFLKTIQDPKIAIKKTSIVDIMCTDDIGNQYIVEMQVADGVDFIKRAQYYAAKAYSSQLNVSDKYHTLKEIIFLAITNFVMFPDKKEFKSDHVILDKHTNEHDLKDFSFTFLELAKFNKSKEQLATIIDKWCYFFKYAEETSGSDLPEIIGNDSIIKRAYEALYTFYWSEEELAAYEAIIKRDRDYNAIMDKIIDKSITKSYNDGMAKGEAKGEIKKAINIAVNLLKKDISIEDISECTGLAITEIEELNYGA